MSDTPSSTTPTEADPPKSIANKIGTALPIALTALATAFAGMSTTELQRAMFWRSYSAQDQAKATSQWTLAGFKRDRALICQSTASQLRALSGNAENPFAVSPPSGADRLAIEWLAGQGPPGESLPEIGDESLKKLLADIQSRVPESDLRKQGRLVKPGVVNSAIDEAERANEKIDQNWDTTLKAAAKLVADSNKESRTAAQAAGFELDRRRYRLEANLNQELSLLYEARVRVSSAISDKHEQKSENFFYAMLAAQIGATVSSLGLARKHKSLLWTIAGCTGLVALSIGGYVYLSDL